jgi:hypothetical protein
MKPGAFDSSGSGRMARVARRHPHRSPGGFVAPSWPRSATASPCTTAPRPGPHTCRGRAALPTRQVVAMDGPHPPVQLVIIAATLGTGWSSPIGHPRAGSGGNWRSLTDNSGRSRPDLTCAIGVASGRDDGSGRAFQACGPGPRWVRTASGTADPRWARAVTAGMRELRVARPSSFPSRPPKQPGDGFEPLRHPPGLRLPEAGQQLVRAGGIGPGWSGPFSPWTPMGEPPRWARRGVEAS